MVIEPAQAVARPGKSGVSLSSLQRVYQLAHIHSESVVKSQLSSGLTHLWCLQYCPDSILYLGHLQNFGVPEHSLIQWYFVVYYSAYASM